MIETPAGMYAAKKPSAMPRSRPLVADAISEGAATTTARKPSPSRKRLTKSCALDAARAPPSPLAVNSTRPVIAVRHGLSRLATAPNTIALIMPVALKMDASQPAATMSRPSSARIPGSAGGNLPTWPAAITAASMAMTTTPQRVAISVLRIALLMPVSS